MVNHVFYKIDLKKKLPLSQLRSKIQLPGKFAPVLFRVCSQRPGEGAQHRCLLVFTGTGQSSQAPRGPAWGPLTYGLAENEGGEAW